MKSNGLEIDLKREPAYGVGKERGSREAKPKTKWAAVKEKWKRARTKLSLKAYARQEGVSK